MNPELEKHTARLQAALELIDPDEADRIIGESTPELKALHEGAESLALMNWWMGLGSGMEKTDDTLQMAASGQAVLLQLVHNAYALGMREGVAVVTSSTSASYPFCDNNWPQFTGNADD